MPSSLAILTLVVLPALAAPVAAQSKASTGDPEPPQLTREREVALALSAAPPAVARGVAVYALGSNGYELAREGSNGYSCMVDRGERGRSQIPLCHNKSGSATLLRAAFRSERLRAAGLTPAQVDSAIDESYRAGVFQPPVPGGISYMLSTEAFALSEDGERIPIPPHLMVYAPYAGNSDLGFTDDERQAMSEVGLPWMLFEGGPGAMIIIWQRDWEGALTPSTGSDTSD